MRENLGITRGQSLLVAEKDGVIVLTPVPPDPIEYLCGILKGEESLTQQLLQERKLDEERNTDYGSAI